MRTAANEVIALENRFWQSMVDGDTDTALSLLDEPALMVSSHGSMQFDHDGYRKMAEHGDQVLTAFELSDVKAVFPTEDTAVLTYRVKQAMAPRDEPKQKTEQQMTDSSVWTRKDGSWRCVMHTETPFGNGKS